MWRLPAFCLAGNSFGGVFAVEFFAVCFGRLGRTPCDASFSVGRVGVLRLALACSLGMTFFFVNFLVTCSRCELQYHFQAAVYVPTPSLYFKCLAINWPWKRPFSMKISLVREPATMTPAT